MTVVRADQLLQSGDDLIVGNCKGVDVETQHSSNDCTEVDKLEKREYICIHVFLLLFFRVCVCVLLFFSLYFL